MNGIDRRAFLIAAPTVGLAAAVAAETVAPMSPEEQIAYHKAELFRLLAESVPEGTELDSLNIALKRGGRGFAVMQARYIGDTSRGYPFFQSDCYGKWEIYVGPDTAIAV